jgi:WhiB family redox-sensing transcriptional regulator
MTSRRHQIKLTAPTPIAEDHWTIQAACRGEDPNLFHIDGDSSWDNQRHATRRTICGQICAPCPVRSECLAAAVEEDDRHAFRGGTTPQERSRLMRKATA